MATVALKCPGKVYLHHKKRAKTIGDSLLFSFFFTSTLQGFPGGSDGKESVCNA